MSVARLAFLSAARSYVAQVAAIPVSALSGPGLGEWDLRALVHGLDIAAAAGVDPAFDSAALVDATTLAAAVAARTGRGPDLLLALTGRAALPDGFSVV